MKRVLIFSLAAVLMGELSSFGQTSTQNFITTSSLLGNGDSIKSTTYYDGFGKPKETVKHNFSPQRSDNVSIIEYDLLGRVEKEWLPANMNVQGAFQNSTAVKVAAQSAYNDSKPYIQKHYESNPLGREVSVIGAGNDWHNANKATNYEYLTNSGANGDLKCKKFTVSDDGCTFTQNGFYEEGDLDVIKTVDEDGKISLEFKDLFGDVVLRRTVGQENCDTYFLYDYKGNLCFVLPPQLSSNLGSASQLGVDNEEIDKLAYVYTYDSKNRRISKKLPGCEPIHYVYDKYHHPIFSQDGNQRAKGKWAFTVYDRLGRVAYSGVTTDSRTAAQLQNAYGLTHYMAEFSSQNELGYPIFYENVCINDIKMVNYYDSYDFLNKFAVGDSLQYRAMANFDEKYVNNTHPQISAKGLLTGAMVRTLDADGVPLLKSIYYDEHGNVIQSHESNLVGGFNREYRHLSFTGKPLSTLQVHSTDSCAWSDLYTFTYDHMERLLTTSLSHDGADAVVLSSNTYDEVGRLASCAVNDGGSNTSYAYNVRGWMQSVINNHFYQWLHYQDAPTGVTPCFNGNISGITWLQRESMKAATSAESVYRFQYDGLNRLTQAAYVSNSEQWNGDLLAMNDRNFSCTYAYDLNSNITALQRYGVDMYNTSLPTHIRHHGMIDDLTMTYDGNQLKKVSDQCEELSYAGAMDFQDSADKDEEYTYDANGNMTCDRNKGIHSITYNMLNLPETVLFNDGHETRYTYATDGRKLRTEYRLNNFAIIEADEATEEAEPANPGTFSLPSVGGIVDEPIGIEPAYTTLMTRDYCGNYIHCNGTLERILTENGYIQGGEYYFYIKDYQGNIRVVLNQANVPVEFNSYYPYGALMAATTTEGTQPYKYSAKELDRQNGLDLYDSQARHYDPIIPRTTTIDPKSETYYPISPYTWCAANPLRYTDPTGSFIRKNMKGEKHYPVVVVFPMNYNHQGSNSSLKPDVDVALNKNIPTLFVKDMDDFADAMDLYPNMGTKGFVINSHGSKGRFSIGSTQVHSEKDVSILSKGLRGKTVFIEACNTGQGDVGQKVTENFAKQTQSTTITSKHNIIMGYEYDGSNKLTLHPTLNFIIGAAFGQNYTNDYLMSEGGKDAVPIYNLRIDKSKGFFWNKGNELLIHSFYDE